MYNTKFQIIKRNASRLTPDSSRDMMGSGRTVYELSNAI